MALFSLDLDPPPRVLRQFGLVALVAFVALGALAYAERGLFSDAFFPGGLGAARLPVALGLAGLGLLVAAFALVRPSANRPLFVALSVLTYPIGVVVSFAVLAVVYFGLFAPLGLFFRLIGRDALHRAREPRAKTYWTKAPPKRDKADYFKTY